MLHQKPLANLIFLDIETVPEYPSFEELPDELKKHFQRKFQPEFDKMSTVRDLTNPVTWESVYNAKAPLHPEWNKIIVISIGMFSDVPTVVKKEQLKFTVKAFHNDNEKELLTEFHRELHDFLNPLRGAFGRNLLVAHAGLIFDFPVLAKRYILNRLPLPEMFDYGHLKPWELNDRFIDTLTVWKYGTFDAGISLDLLAYRLGAPSSKTDMDGSMVKDVYYKEKDLKRIATYCNEDVKTLAEVFLRLKNMDNPIEHITL